MPSLTDERLGIVHLNNLVTKLRQIGANALNCLDDRNMVNVRWPKLGSSPSLEEQVAG